MLPGFGAERSLYSSKSQYGPAASWTHLAGSPGIYPATELCTKDCFCDVYDGGQPGTCSRLCYVPGQPAYPKPCGPGGRCDPPCGVPICGPCTKTCHYPNGPSFTQNC